MNRIPLAVRIERTGTLLCPAQRELFLLPVKTLCDFMAQEAGQQDYLTFYETYLRQADPDQTVCQTVHKVSKLGHSMARHALELLLVRPFLAAQQENKQNK